MIIRKKKHPKILSSIGGNSSKITSIKDKTLDILINEGQNPLGLSVSQKVVKRDCEEIDYEFYFKCDMRNLISIGATEIEFLVVKSDLKISPGFFKNISEKSPISVSSVIFGQKSDNSRIMTNDFNDKVIMKGKIDMINEIRDTRMSRSSSKSKKSNDSDMFGSAIKSVIVEKRSLKRKGLLNKRMPQVQTSTVDNNSVENSLEVSDIYTSLLSNGIDPVDSLRPMINMSSPDPTISPGLVTNKIYSSNRNLNKNLNSMRSKFEKGFSNSFPQTTVKYGSGNSDYITIEKSVPDRVRDITHKFKINSRLLYSMSSFFIILRIRDKKSGMITEKFNVRVNHKINVENYYIPGEIPIVSSVMSSNGSRRIAASIGKKDNTINDEKIYIRKIVDDSPLVLFPFKEFIRRSKIPSPGGQNGNISTPPSENIFDGSSFQNGTKNLNMIRVCPVIKTGLKLSNFSSTSVSGRSFNYTSCSITAKNIGGGILISVSDITSDISGVAIYKKIAGSRVPFKLFSKALGQERLDFRSSENFTRTTTAGRIMIDSNVKEGLTYIYRARLFFKSGGDKFSKVFATAKCQRNAEFLSISTSNLKISNASIGNSLYGKDTIPYNPAMISFNIDYNILDTQSDILLSILQDAGMEDLFGGEIEQIKNSLSDRVVFGIFRKNITLSEEIFLGYSGSGEFKDDGSSAPFPTHGMKYIYSVRAFLTTPEEFSRAITTKLQTDLNVVKNTSMLLLPSTFTSIRSSVVNNLNLKVNTTAVGSITSVSQELDTEAIFQSVKLTKNFDKMSLSKGTLASQTKTTPDDVLQKFDIGDNTEILVNLAEFDFTISSTRGQSVTTSSKGFPVLRFSVIPATDFATLKLIDSIVISCERQGRRSICGSAHPSESIVFVDYTNKDYIGQINYYATIIKIDGTVIDDKIVGSTVLVDRSPKKKKIRKK